MKSSKYIISTLLCILFLTSCFKEEQYDNSAIGNFDACWKLLDEKYCFFEYKKEEYGLDWDDVYNKYRPMVGPGTTVDSLFTILDSMTQELRDGHVNIYSSFNIGRYWKWFTDYPDNFNAIIQENYIGDDYLIAGGLRYKMLPDSIGYIYYPSFSSFVGENNLDYVLYHFRNTKGIIFDIRNNGGGMLTNVDRIAARFTAEQFRSGYIQHKTGPGRDEFSSLYPFDQISTPKNRFSYHRPVMLLTNRKVFSAANQFVSVMRHLPQVTIIGDKTGGGSGLPFNGELPIGWAVRFSASPVYDADKQHTEFGIDPDFKVNMTEADINKGIDTIIEFAIKKIQNSNPL